MLSTDKFQEELQREIREQTGLIIAEETERAAEQARSRIAFRVRELAMQVSMEIAKRFEIVGNETTITVRYKP